MRTKEEEKEYKEAMEYLMAKEKAEKEVLEEIRKSAIDPNFYKSSENPESWWYDLIKSWQKKLK